MPFSAQTRAANLTRMAEQRFDLLVIGGGITGAGIALDAASRGYSVALVEKDDYASGTSGRSSRLIHGGLRYLEQREFGLVRESLRERGILYRLAPHLVRPVPLYILAGDRRSRAKYRAGLTGYEMLAAGRNIGYHKAVSARRVAEAIPGLGESSRGFRYFECQTDDARLTLEVARAAQVAGAVLANHARVTGMLGDGRVTGARPRLALRRARHHRDFRRDWHGGRALCGAIRRTSQGGGAAHHARAAAPARSAHRDRLAVLAFDDRDDLVCGRLVAGIADDNLEAARRCRERGGTADAAAAAGDDRYPVSHNCPRHSTHLSGARPTMRP